jgi:S1-C subfamily serine protease
MNLKSNNGSLVQFVIPQTTADKLGVKPYDLITNCNNVAIHPHRL